MIGAKRAPQLLVIVVDMLRVQLWENEYRWLSVSFQDGINILAIESRPFLILSHAPIAIRRFAREQIA